MANGDNARRIDDALSYPVITQEVNGSRRSSAPGTPGGGTQYAQMVQGALRDILGWRTRDNDPKGFMAALTQSFAPMEVSGSTKWKWTPHTYAVQADLGAITGAQAAIYAGAKAALDQSIPLVDGLRPLRSDADMDDAESARFMVRSTFMELVQQLGEESGPLNTRVDGYFTMLLGDDADDVPANDSQLGLLRETFGLEQSQVNTIAEEQNLTNFLLVVQNINALRFSWNSHRDNFDRTGADAFLGTQSVLLARELAVVAEAVQETYFVMDSVFLGQAEREITELKLELQPGQITRVFIGELLHWVEDFAIEEGPRLIQEGGKDGVIHSFLPTVNKLREMVKAAAELSHNGSTPALLPAAGGGNNSATNPTAAFHSVRVGRALDELSSHLEKTAERADQIKRDPAPSITGVLPTVSESSAGEEIIVLSVIGENFDADAALHLESADETDDTTINPTRVFFLHESELRATFDRDDAAGQWIAVVTNPDGQSAESEPFTIDQVGDNDNNDDDNSNRRRRLRRRRSQRAARNS